MSIHKIHAKLHACCFNLLSTSQQARLGYGNSRAKTHAAAPKAVLAATWTGCIIGSVSASLMYPITYTITIWPRAIRFAIKWVFSGSATTKALTATAAAVVPVVRCAVSISHSTRIAGQTLCMMAHNASQQPRRVSPSAASVTIRMAVT